MRQSAFTILTSVNAGEVRDLERLLNEIGNDVIGNRHLRFADLEGLHYASLFIVAGETSDPYLIFEGNVDGPADAFLEYLLEIAGEAVDKIYRHCPDFPSAGSRDLFTVLHYLKAHDIGADTFYVAWPGRTVEEIRREQGLRDHMEVFLDGRGADALDQLSPHAIRREIEGSLTDDMAWARTAGPTPFLVKQGQKVLYLILAPPVLTLLGLVKASLGGSSSRKRTWLARVKLVTLVALGVGAARRLRAEERNDERKDRGRVADWQTVYARWSETEELKGIVSTEDRQDQNHMVSVTTVKQGWFRLAILRVVLWVVNLIARLTANRGSLGGISSIHFARWVITPDNKSLIFLSNFDGSWESYLNDFIDLAARGLTAVWTNTDNAVGFPTTKWLVTEGARDEARFKAYARYSMVPTNVWYSAYPDISVANIANNMRLRDDLCAPLDLPATEAWLRRL